MGRKTVMCIIIVRTPLHIRIHGKSRKKKVICNIFLRKQRIQWINMKANSSI